MKGYIPDSATDLVSFKSVFGELSVAKQLVLRGTRIVLPESLQPDVITLAHKGHQASTKTIIQQTHRDDYSISQKERARPRNEG